MGEVAVRLWLAFQTSSQHKITSWEDNLWACDNLFRLTFLQSVKATERYRGSARDQWLLVTSAKQHPASGFSNHTERGRHCFISFILRYSAPHSIASALCNFQLTACFVTHIAAQFLALWAGTIPCCGCRHGQLRTPRTSSHSCYTFFKSR